ncbi:DUF484 family protein [Gallaecimonas pentaromativorans]|uniref:DUF484 family protein n=1 Tax=Gallaecimonas pentaromativorans TaxID=584787 RepID=A0A3N1PC37_9GAMM|nr:DUF484 family protein [Gallaecimonas pentaromativorans]MED5526208.1 DUF484 family protein [Pseudomonadota bacterium]ROQ24400.1 hypothetical protein EDC28_107283 [Gallaecimonas pentaromativorans]
MSESNTASLLALDEDLIAEYLESNPDFFHRNPRLLERLRLPHGERGSVSLLERQLELARHRHQNLEEEITGLLSVAAHNEQVAVACHRLSLEAMASSSLDQLIALLGEGVRRHLGMEISRLVLCARLAETQHKALQSVYARLEKGAYFGRLTEDEKRLLLGHAPQRAGSLALMPVRKDAELLGIWVIASPDPGHFQPDMDALLISQLCEVVALKIASFGHGRLR